MAAFQFGAAQAKGLFPVMGPQGAATLRLCFGAALLLILTRPWRRWPAQAPVVPLIGLGAAMAATILLFYMAIARLPLAIAIALQFLGPLCVAVLGSRRPIDLLWALLAAIGVWSLVDPLSSHAPLDPVGIVIALGAATGWAFYIVVGRTVANAFGGAAAAWALSIAALFVLPVGIVEAGTSMLTVELLPLALGVALFSAALPFSLELYALPRIPARAFAVFTSLEPAFGVIFGYVILHEVLSPTQIAGIALVVTAAAGAAWQSAKRAAPPLD
jgi:inner membrane transporter RhtA